MNHALTDCPAPTPAAQTAEGRAVLDPLALAALQRLQPQAGAEFVARVLRAYLGSLHQHRSLAEQAWQQEQWEALGHSAHALKAASASVGARHLADLCTQLELALRQGDGAPLHAVSTPKAVAELTARFLAEVDRVVATVRHMPGVAA